VLAVARAAALEHGELSFRAADDLVWELDEFGDLDAERLVARALGHAVQHGQAAGRCVERGRHVAVAHAHVACDGRQLVEVRREERWRADHLRKGHGLVLTVGGGAG